NEILIYSQESRNDMGSAGLGDEEFHFKAFTDNCLTFSEVFSDLLVERKVRQKDVAAIVQVSAATVSGWVNGFRPKPGQIDEIAMGFLSPDEQQDVDLQRNIKVRLRRAYLCSEAKGIFRDRSNNNLH
ncbi:MAG: helix-turn-helix transcriptional regulator, partial [Chloroflexota bacterium]